MNSFQPDGFICRRIIAFITRSNYFFLEMFIFVQNKDNRMKEFKKILSLLLIVFTLAGTTGFTLMEHQCSHCGTDISLLLDTGENGEPDCCHNEVEKTCCSETEAITDELCSAHEESCCSNITINLELTDPAELISLEKSPLFTPVLASIITSKDDLSQGHINYFIKEIKPPGISLYLRHSAFLT